MKITSALLLSCIAFSATAADTTITIQRKYLNLPVSQQQERVVMTYSINGVEEQRFNIRLSKSPEYWVFSDVSAYHGKTIHIRCEGDSAALRMLYQADRIAGHDSLYREERRPQYHFSARRGWINDPNGLVYHEGEYHLFYQHNPFEREWENMSWGHAVSRDLVHWDELPVALHPDKTGTMFSGSIVIDHGNTSGFGEPGKPAMVALYTTDSPDRQVQCVAYSLDKGRTWTKYRKNPVIDSKEKGNTKDTRDPRVFWYAPGKHWVMVLNEYNGHSIYTSDNLKSWKYRSHVNGFWECPDLFELAVEGNPQQKKWIMLGASGTYMIGSFDGKTFTPESGKYYYCTGSLYASQTFNNIPASDGRRIQIGWGRIQQRGMPFNNMMLLPTELTLRQTKDGLRLFSMPVKETGQLFTSVLKVPGMSSSIAEKHMTVVGQEDKLLVKIKFSMKLATEAGVSLNGQRIIAYNMNFNTVNGVFYSPQDPTSLELSADIYIDRSSIEVFIDGGAYSYSMERMPAEGYMGLPFKFWGDMTLQSIEVFKGKKIWP